MAVRLCWFRFHSGLERLESTCIDRDYLRINGFLSRFLQGMQRVPRRCYYYVPPKKRAGPGLKGWMAVGGIFVGLTGFGIAVIGRPETVEQHQRYESEHVVMAYLLRSKDAIQSYYDTFALPSSTVLLPNPLPEPYQPPYTLVLEMSDVLVHAEYELKCGWRYRKRPGLTAFLRELAPFYEIIIFTTEAGFNAQPVVAAIDPNGEAIFYTLFRDSTTYLKGKHIKDLNNLNRDLKRVIALDVDPASCERNKQNVLLLQRWEGNTADRTLVDLVAFLKTIAMSGVDDVRPVVDFYRKQDDPLLTFKQNQARLAEQALKQQQLMQEIKSNPAGGSNWSSSGFMGKLFGRGRNQMQTQTESQASVSSPEVNTSAGASSDQARSESVVNNKLEAGQSASDITNENNGHNPPSGGKSLLGRWFG